MTRAVVLAVGLAVGVGAWYALRRVDSGGELDFSSLETGSIFGDDLIMVIQDAARWMGIRSVANLGRADRAMLSNNNVRAMLRVIRAGESGQTDAAYRVIVGGRTFSSFADHPRIFGVPQSTAAGAYQITKTTWDWIKPQMKLVDFSPASQDFAALGLIAYRGALKDVLSGNLDSAIGKLRKEWTSLPGAAESGLISRQRAREIFVAYGGQIAGAVFV